VDQPSAGGSHVPSTATPDAVVEAYVATWNETDPARRRAGLAMTWTETGITAIR
jgi:hypothetical protein